MELNNYVTQALSRTHRYDGDDPKKIIIKNDINLAALLWGTRATFAEDFAQKEWVKQVARALNLILIEDFDDVNSWLEAFNIDRHYIEMLWDGKLIPRKSLIDNLTKVYGVDHYSIYNDTKDIIRHREEESAAV